MIRSAARQVMKSSRMSIQSPIRRGVMSNRQLKRRVEVAHLKEKLAEQKQIEENPRPLQFTPNGDVSQLPFSIRRSGPAQNLPVYLGKTIFRKRFSADFFLNLRSFKTKQITRTEVHVLLQFYVNVKVIWRLCVMNLKRFARRVPQNFTTDGSKRKAITKKKLCNGYLNWDFKNHHVQTKHGFV